MSDVIRVEAPFVRMTLCGPVVENVARYGDFRRPLTTVKCAIKHKYKIMTREQRGAGLHANASFVYGDGNHLAMESACLQEQRSKFLIRIFF